MKSILKPLLLISVILSSIQCKTKTLPFTFSKDTNITIFLNQNEPEYVRLAVKDLIEDVEQIIGLNIKIATSIENCIGNCIVIGTASDTVIRNILNTDKLSVIEGSWERYLIYTSQDGIRSRLNIIGSNPRGTMFGIYYFLEKKLGVDPLRFWTGYEPQKRNKIELENIDYVSGEPDFKFRGWFINDEDLLSEFKESGGARNIDYPYYGQVVNTSLIKEVAEAAVRLRYNLIIPASFIDIRNPEEERLVAEVSKRGLYISMHHIEPLGVSAFGYQNYWKEKGEKPLFSFYSEKEKLMETWREYAKRWAKYPDVIWQIGLRGIADRPMWLADPGVPQSNEVRAQIISDAMHVQKEIIQDITGDDNPLLSTTLWAEGSYFYQKGILDIPNDAMIIFSDNSAGWVWQKDFYETKRLPSSLYGVYYHHQLWSSGPHLTQAVPPSKTYAQFKEAMEYNSNTYAIMNVSNIREFTLALQASSEMLWQMDSFDSANYIMNWCVERFPDAPEGTYMAYKKLFDSYTLTNDTQYPLFLDGLQKLMGFRILNEIEKILDGIKVNEKKNSKKVDPFSASLTNAYPRAKGDLHNQLFQLTQQVDSLSYTLVIAKEQQEKLSGDSLSFFESNMVGQTKILFGLGKWLQGCIKAQIALGNNQNWEQVSSELKESIKAFELIDEGKKLGSQGNWENWYRGDKKMNTDGMKARTYEVLEKVCEKI